MVAYLFIGIGGMVGSLLRYFIFIWSGNIWGHSFPIGTLVTNIIGAFLLGIFTRKISRNGRVNANIVLAIGTGAIGSFTTMSTLSTEAILLIEKGANLSAFIYIILSVLAGLLAAWFGYGGIRGKREGTK